MMVESVKGTSWGNPEAVVTTGVFEGRMTHADYSRWFMENFSKSSPDNSVFANALIASMQQDEIDHNFDLIRQSEFLSENFLKFPNAVQRSVVPFVTRVCPIVHIEAFAQQAIKMLDRGVGFSFDAWDSNELSSRLQERLSIELTKLEAIHFEMLLGDYVALYDTEMDAKFSPMLIGNVVRMLTLLHGASVVIEVLRRWNVVSRVEQLEDFVAVVENWQDFQQYPLDWAISMLRGENVE